MLFSSTIFLFAFLPIVLGLYFALRGIPSRNALLLAASLLFYAWGETGYVAVLLVSIAGNYASGLWIDRCSAGARTAAVAAAVSANLLLLGSFKYANFVADTVNPLLAGTGLPELSLAPIHLPIGVSFFTFQALTYVIDVHRRDAPVLRNPFHLALYISLFPQLIAGPIVRYRQIAAQIRDRTTSLDDAAVGARRFVVGLGKKVLIANTLAVPVDRIFAVPVDELQAPVAWLGAVGYGLQIYFDFSGYSDMAIGLGRIFGFRFPENFLHPYTSQSVREFWRRWHVTLSTWFRDYLYVPLGGNRKGAARTLRNLLLVFTLCGLWHGASFSFLVWGLLHGAFMVAERMGGDAALQRLPRAMRHAYLLFVVTLAWVFFRADDLGHAIGFLQAMFRVGAAPESPHTLPLFLDLRVLLVAAGAVLGSTPWLARLRDVLPSRYDGAVRGARLALLNAVLLLSAMSLAAGTHNPFIYFRF